VPWVLLDVAIVVLALAVFGLMAHALYKRVRGLMRTVGAASAQVGELAPGLTVTPPASH